MSVETPEHDICTIRLIGIGHQRKDNLGDIVIITIGMSRAELHKTTSLLKDCLKIVRLSTTPPLCRGFPLCFGGPRLVMSNDD